jgi:hypothetical protein
MNTQLSDADLTYCVGHGIITKWDSMFYTSARNRNDMTGYSQSRFNELSNKLSYYHGIANRVSVMKEHIASKSQQLRDYKAAARIAYQNLNKPGSVQLV